MPIWDRLDRALARAVNAHWGVACRLSPMIRSEYGAPQPDPNRRTVPFKGEFALNPADTQLPMAGATRAFSNVPKPRVKVSAEEAAKIGYTPQNGDLVTITGRHGQPVYTISEFEIHDNGDLLLYLFQ